MFSRWKLALETSANFVATAAFRRWIPARVSGKCVMGIMADYSKTALRRMS